LLWLPACPDQCDGKLIGILQHFINAPVAPIGAVQGIAARHFEELEIHPVGVTLLPDLPQHGQLHFNNGSVVQLQFFI
jgi:hypothetical protein